MGKSVFNSLGSNYSLKFISVSLASIFTSRKSDLLNLESFLAKEYRGEVATFYKGRDAIEAALRVLLEPGSEVITQAFTCYAIEEAIVRAGMIPIYADISRHSTNMTAHSLDIAFQQNPHAKAVLIQHSLGISANSYAIRKWCDKHGLLLLDDIAQGIGGVDEMGSNLGHHADAIIFSFGRDKIIDSTAGGAVVFKNMNDKKIQRLLDMHSLVANIPFVFVYEDLIYPDLTSFIRKTHHLGLGKVILVVSKAFGLLGSPIKSRTQTMARMHPALARLAMMQFKSLDKQINHRRQMATEYFKHLSDSNVEPLITKEELNASSNLRFSIRCENKEQVDKLILALKNQRIYVSDRWYRSAVDCGNFECKTVYQPGSCPNAELLASQVLNLPTHREINLRLVQKICKIILENS